MMMKKTIPLWLAGLGLVAITGMCMAQAVPGGYAQASVQDKEVLAAASCAVEAKEKAIRKNKDKRSAKLVLVKVLGAQTQVVAGTNFRLRVKVKLDGEVKEADAVVFRNLSGKRKLTSWEWIKSKGEGQPGEAGGGE